MKPAGSDWASIELLRNIERQERATDAVPSLGKAWHAGPLPSQPPPTTPSHLFCV